MVIEHDPDPATGARRRERVAIPVLPECDYLKKEDAEAILYARLTDLNRGAISASVPVTVAEHLRAYLGDCASRKLRKTTIAGYKASIEKHLIPAFGEKMRLTDLEPAHIRSMCKGMSCDGYEARTIDLAYVVLHAALKQGVIDGKLYRNVADAVEPPRPRRKKIYTTLLPEQVAPALERVRALDERMYRLGALCVYTGLSRSEILARGYTDVDFVNARMGVTSALTVTDGEYVVDLPKTEQRTRYVPLVAEALQLLGEMKSEATCDLLFHDEDGHYLNPSTVSKDFSRAMSEAGYPGVTLHKLRHTFATNMLRAGVSIKHVQVLLGHSSIKTTGDIYAHVVEDDLRNAIDTYGKSLRKKSSAPTRHQPSKE
jgi:integrase